MPANCSATFENGKWACEHRRTSTANMVKFRQVTAGQTVNNWQNVGVTSPDPSDHIAFGLGSKGFVAINRTASSAVTTYATSMPAGSYCDIVHYDFNPTTGECLVPGTATRAPAADLIVVDANDQIVNKTLNAMDAFAIHSGAKPAGRHPGRLRRRPAGRRRAADLGDGQRAGQPGLQPLPQQRAGRAGACSSTPR